MVRLVRCRLLLVTVTADLLGYLVRLADEVIFGVLHRLSCFLGIRGPLRDLSRFKSGSTDRR